jgi:dephospho-CoA kinase
LTGGLASGKTFIGKLLASLGCEVIRADELGHAVLLPDGEAYAAVIAEFGSGILKEDGRIDRKRLGSIVFGNADRLAKLNSLVHPRVFDREQRMLDAIERRDPRAIAVVEAAIMIESGSYRRYDKIIVAVCPRELQIERAMHRDDTGREEIEQRLERQMPLAEKVKYADFVIDTSGSKEVTAKQVQSVYEELRRLPS